MFPQSALTIKAGVCCHLTGAAPPDTFSVWTSEGASCIDHSGVQNIFQGRPGAIQEHICRSRATAMQHLAC